MCTQIRTNPQLVVVPDHELRESNLVEEKHRKLARSIHSSQHDLKPNAGTRDQLTTIMQYPPSKQLTSEEEDLIWKFRHVDGEAYFSALTFIVKLLCAFHKWSSYCTIFMWIGLPFNGRERKICWHIFYLTLILFLYLQVGLQIQILSLNWVGDNFSFLCCIF